MTIDDEQVSWREMARRQREADDAQARAEWEARELTESDEAQIAYWCGVFAARPSWMRDEHWNEQPGIDRRVFHVSGDMG